MKPTTITLESPVVRGDNKITEITLHSPNAGMLRGVSMRAVLDMEVDAIAKIIPRISDPKLTESETASLDLPDFLKAGAAIAGFFLPKEALEEAQNSQQSQTM